MSGTGTDERAEMIPDASAWLDAAIEARLGRAGPALARVVGWLEALSSERSLKRTPPPVAYAAHLYLGGRTPEEIAARTRSLARRAAARTSGLETELMQLHWIAAASDPAAPFRL